MEIKFEINWLHQDQNLQSIEPLLFKLLTLSQSVISLRLGNPE